MVHFLSERTDAIDGSPSVPATRVTLENGRQQAETYAMFCKLRIHMPMRLPAGRPCHPFEVFPTAKLSEGIEHVKISCVYDLLILVISV